MLHARGRPRQNCGYLLTAPRFVGSELRLSRAAVCESLLVMPSVEYRVARSASSAASRKPWPQREVNGEKRCHLRTCRGRCERLNAAKEFELGLTRNVVVRTREGEDVEAE